MQVLRDGTPVSATVAVDGDTWRVTDTRVADGSHTYTARVVDADGAGPDSAGYTIVVDTENGRTASITSITDNVAPGVGTIRDGGVTNDPTPTLNGRLSSALADGEQLQILRNDAVISDAPQINGTGWTFTDSSLPNGNYDYAVRIVDAAGNVGRESSVYDVRVSRIGGILLVSSAAVPAGFTSEAGMPEMPGPIVSAAGGAGASLHDVRAIDSLLNPELLATGP